MGAVAVALEVVREGGAEAVESHRPPVGRAVSFMGVEREIAVARIVFQKDVETVRCVHLDAADGDVAAVLALVDVAMETVFVHVQLELVVVAARVAVGEQGDAQAVPRGGEGDRAGQIG